MTDAANAHTATSSRDYAVGLGRAFAGATIFGLPLLMTMEMWELGPSLAPLMLIQFSLGNLLILYGLSKVAGFKASHRSLDDVLDALAAYAVGVAVSIVGLTLVGVLGPDTNFFEAVSKIAIQAVPASFGAMIGARIIGEDKVEQGEQWRDTYPGQLFLFAAGALFLSFAIAPTEEVSLISFQITPWHALLLVLLSILLLHLILHVVGFRGQDKRTDSGEGRALLLHTLPGYAVAASMSAYVLWTFGSTSGLDWPHLVMAIAVLGFPAALGAAIARIVV